MRQSADEDRSPDPGWLAFLVAFIAFVGSALAYGLALLTRSNVAASLAVNAAAALILVGWAANSTLTDPASDVRTLPGAIGTALLLLAGYFVSAAVLVGITSIWHGRVDLAIALAVAGGVAGVAGLAMFPVAVLLDTEPSGADDGPA